MKNFIIENKTIKIDEGIKRAGKDEMNLVELPFTLLTKKNPEQLKTIERYWIGKDENGNEKKFYKIITGSDKWGLPTFIGEELFLACMELSYKQGFESRKIHTSKYELINSMGWSVNGESYRRLIKALNQLLGITITTNAFWDNGEKRYREIGFGIIDDYMFFEEEKKGRKSKNDGSSAMGFFHWNKIFFEHSIQKGNIKTLDVDLYFSLATATAKRLYRFADKKLYDNQPFEIDLFRLAFEKLEMIGEYKYPSKIVEKLKPAIDELKKRNICEIEIRESKTDSGYKVCFKPIAPADIKSAPQEKINRVSVELLKYFHMKLGRDVQEYYGTNKEFMQAEKLLTLHTREELLFIIDYAVEQAQKTGFEMQYFGALANYVDKGLLLFKQKTEQDARLKKELDDKKQEEQAVNEYEAYKQRQIDCYIRQISPEDYRLEIERTGEKVLELNPVITNKKSKLFQHLIESHFNQFLIDSGKVTILAFNDWKRANANL